MISLLAIPPGDMSAAALLLVVGPGLIGLQVEAVILLVVGPGLTGGSATKEVEGADSFLDFFGAFFGGRYTALFFPFAVQEERISHT